MRETRLLKVFEDFSIANSGGDDRRVCIDIRSIFAYCPAFEPGNTGLDRYGHTWMYTLDDTFIVRQTPEEVTKKIQSYGIKDMPFWDFPHVKCGKVVIMKLSMFNINSVQQTSDGCKVYCGRGEFDLLCPMDDVLACISRYTATPSGFW